MQLNDLERVDAVDRLVRMKRGRKSGQFVKPQERRDEEDTKQRERDARLQTDRFYCFTFGLGGNIDGRDLGFGRIPRIDAAVLQAEDIHRCAASFFWWHRSR